MIKYHFKKLNEVPESFEGYKEIVNSNIELHKILDNLVNDRLIHYDDAKGAKDAKDAKDVSSKEENGNTKIRTQLSDAFSSLIELASQVAYEKRQAFIIQHT